MGNELEDALRAAAAVRNANDNGVMQTQTSVGQSPQRKRNKKVNRRHRKRSRSDSMASDFSSANDDPVQRLEAFKARMFDVGKASAATTFGSAPSKAGEDIVKVQWKAKKLTGGRRAGEGDEEEDAVPQLTRARATKSQLVSGGVAVTTIGKRAKKTNAKKKKANVQMELMVPQPTQPVKAPAPKQQAQVKTTVARKPMVKSTVEDGSSQSEDELPAAPVVKTPVQSAPAHEESSESEDESPVVKKMAPCTRPQRESSESEDDSPAAPALVLNKPTTSNSSHDESSGSEEDLPPSEPAPTMKATAKPASKLAVKTAALSSAKKVKTEPAPVATAAVAKKPMAKPTLVATTAPTPSAKPARARSASITNEDKWDLNSLVQNAVLKKKAVSARKPSMTEEEEQSDDADDEDGGDFQGKKFKDHRMHLFSQLIDEAARDQWELVEVGRLVRIFAAQWSHKKKKTARFLRRYCPELVSVDFLEGLNINLEPKQLIAIFERGSGSQGVLLNKVTSAIENNNIHVQDDAFLKYITSKTDPMASNQEVLEFVVPLLESMSNVKDVGVLLKAICQHWQLERTAALVQDILLTPVFDDLDGQHDEILEDLPHLEGRIDFPSRMDAEDADENGNLKGLIAGEESDLGESDAGSEDEKEEELGEVLSEDAEGEDSHAEDEVYEGETDSEEEREAHERLNPPKRRRSRFILDEVEEDEDEDEAMDREEDDFVAEDDEESEDSSDDSDSEDDAASKPQRKRLRRG